jgi:hypothetical protein
LRCASQYIQQSLSSGNSSLSTAASHSHFVLPSGRETHFMLPFKLLYRRRPEVEHNNNNNNNNEQKKNWETTAACLLL